MIDNLISGGIGFIIGSFAGFMIAALLASARTYNDEEYENTDLEETDL